MKEHSVIKWSVIIIYSLISQHVGLFIFYTKSYKLFYSESTIYLFKTECYGVPNHTNQGTSCHACIHNLCFPALIWFFTVTWILVCLGCC